MAFTSIHPSIIFLNELVEGAISGEEALDRASQSVQCHPEWSIYPMSGNCAVVVVPPRAQILETAGTPKCREADWPKI